MTPEQIANLSTAQVISLTLKGHLALDASGAAVFTDKAAKAVAREAVKARRAAVLEELTEFFTTPKGQTVRFWSIKPTSGSFAAAAAPINRFVEASREDILWSLKQLEKKGLARQVGIKSELDEDGNKFPVVVEPHEVNNFQRRWVHSVEAAPEEEEAEAPGGE